MNKERIKDILYQVSLDDGGELSFSEIKKYLSDDSFLTFYSYDEDVINLEIYTEREETDEELALRVEKFKRVKEETRERDYQVYLRLKSKFENE